MKKIRVIQIIELIILILIAIGLVSFLSSVSKGSIEGKQPQDFKNSLKDNFKSGFNFNWNIGAENLTALKEEEVSSSGIEKIKVDAGSADINVFVTDSTVIKVIQSGDRVLTKEELFTLSNQKGVLTITRGKSIPRLIFGGSKRRKIELFIPESYSGDLDLNTSSGDTELLSELKLRSLGIEQASGNISADYPIEVKSFNGHLSSGNMRLDYLKCDKYEISTASGNTTINTLKGSGSIEASSGNIKVKELVGGIYSIKAASGNIELRNVAGDGEATTTSGNINIDYTEILEYAKLNAASGNIRIRLSERISFKMDAKCSSGDIDGNIDMNYTNKKGNEAEAIIGNGPYAKITLNTSSGDITVDQN